MIRDDNLLFVEPVFVLSRLYGALPVAHEELAFGENQADLTHKEWKGMSDKDDAPDLNIYWCCPHTCESSTGVQLATSGFVAKQTFGVTIRQLGKLLNPRSLAYHCHIHLQSF